MKTSWKSLAFTALFVVGLTGWAAAQGSSTRYPDSNADWRNPSRSGIRVRELVKVQVEGMHLESQDETETRFNGLKVLPSARFKVSKAVDKKGQELSKWRDVPVRYADSKKGKDLLKKLADGQYVKIKGKLDLENRLLEVESFEVLPLVADSKEKKQTQEPPAQEE